MVTNDDAFPSDSTLAHPLLITLNQTRALPELSMGTTNPLVWFLGLSGPFHPSIYLSAFLPHILQSSCWRSFDHLWSLSKASEETFLGMTVTLMDVGRSTWLPKVILHITANI